LYAPTFLKALWHTQIARAHPKICPKYAIIQNAIMLMFASDGVIIEDIFRLTTNNLNDDSAIACTSGNILNISTLSRLK